MEELKNYFPNKEELLKLWMERNLVPFENEELKILKEWYPLFGFETIFEKLLKEKFPVYFKTKMVTLAKFWIYFYCFYANSRFPYQCKVHHSDLIIANGFEASLDITDSEEFRKILKKYPNTLLPSHSLEQTKIKNNATVFLYCKNCTKEFSQY